MAKKPGLTPKQHRFVAEYLKDLNATQAAIRAGYVKKWAEKNSVRLTGNSGVAAAIAKGAGKQIAKAELTGQMIVDRLRLLAFQDVRSIYDERGNLLPIHSLSDAAAAMIGGVEVIIKNAKAGDGVTDTIHKVKIIDPVQPLEILAKRFGLLKDIVEHRFSLEDLVTGSNKDE